MSKLYPAIIKTGLIAGTLDILAAITSYYLRTGKTPEGIFKFIASGAFGKTALGGGTEMIVAGFLFHYLIAFGFTIAFFLLYPRLQRWLSPYIVVTGLVYGMVVWCIMNLVVLPLSNTPAIKPASTQQMIIGMSFLVFLVGLPIAVFAKKHYRST